MRRLETSPKLVIPDTVPDLRKGAFKEVAQHDTLVMAGGERRDAAGKNVAVHGHIGDRPGALAGPPWSRVGSVLCQAVPRVSGTGSLEPYPQISTHAFTLSEDVLNVVISQTIERLLFTGETNSVAFIVEHQALKIDLTNPQVRGQPNEIGQLGDILFHARTPQREL